MNEWMNDWNEWMNEWLKWMNEWLNEWLNDLKQQTLLTLLLWSWCDEH